MAPNLCWRCLTHQRSPSHQLSILSSQTHIRSTPSALFSTSATLSATPTKAKGANPNEKKGAKTAFVLKKKKRTEKVGRPPATGERKALRKRVLLSNMNALDVPDLDQLGTDTEVNEEMLGKIISLPSHVIDQLNALQVFGHRQSWGMFKRPSILVRDYTLELSKLFSNPDSSARKTDVTRQVIVGAKGSGKSVYLLQALGLAMTNNWTVIHVPDVRSLTAAISDYSPIPGTSPTQYSQKDDISALLQAIVKANPMLKTLQLQTKPRLPIPVQEKMSLDRFANLGADPEIAQQVFQALWAELTAPGRPPILLTMDDFSLANKPSEYLNASFKKIHAQDLYLINWFISYLSGKANLPNGGAVIAATSNSNFDVNPALDIRLKQIEAYQGLKDGTYNPPEDLTLPFLQATGQQPSPVPAADPFYKYDSRVLDVFGGQDAAIKSIDGATPIRVRRVNGVNKEEARALMEYWAKSGIVRSQVSDQLVSQKWTMAGGGILGELEKGCFGVRS